MQATWVATAILAGSLIHLGTPLMAQTEFVYVLNQNATADIAAYSVNAATGALSPVPGSPFAAGAGIAPGTYSYYQGEIASDPLGRFLYVPTSAGGGRGGVNVYIINPTSGALTAVSGSPFSLNGSAPYGGPRPGPIVADQTGHFLFVGAASRDCMLEDDCGAIHVFAIDSSGALASVAGSPYELTSEVRSLAIDPAGKFLYTRYSAFVINSATGALSPVPGCSPLGDCAALANDATSVAMDPRGRFLFKAGASMATFRIDPNSGALALTANTPPPAGGALTMITVDPTGRFLYGSSLLAAQVFTYLIDENTGAVSPVPGSPFAAPPDPRTVAVDRSGRFVYVASLSGTVAAYSINQTSGALAPVGGSPFAAGAHPRSVTTSQRVLSTLNFVGRDTVTQGNWGGVYGQDGKYMPAHYYGAPAYSSFRFDNANERLYTYTNSDPRALQMATNPAQRIESYLDSVGTMAFHLSTTDNRVHRVALYFADYNRSGRSVTVRAIDKATGVVLDTQVPSPAEYAEGVYLVYLYSGPVTFQVISNKPAASGIPGTVSGIFWGGGVPAGPNITISINPVPSPIVGRVMLSVAASPEIVKVQYQLDGSPLSPVIMGGAFNHPWNTQAPTVGGFYVTNGKHLLGARGFDAATNEYNAFLEIQINNPPPDFDLRFWAKQTPGHSPGARQAAAMAYDPNRGEMVLFGGMPANSETWVFDGFHWIQRNSVKSPSGNGAMVY
ncbi:MAG: beta-propeller fold lactonase family protein, partial [Bryobacterales bacterium]|nr:beta-propeller fold lactonase family protein [Bryobacterales bacterium]